MATTDININPRTEELKTEFSNMIWKMATNLVHGGKVNPVQFMDYTLGGLFYRFISENITDYCNQLMRDAGVENADYAHMSDEMAENRTRANHQCQRLLYPPFTTLHQCGERSQE